MSSIKNQLSVFLSSPGDLLEERQAVRDAIERYRRVFAEEDYDLKILTWDTHVSPALTGDPQKTINEQIGDDYDFFIGVIGNRFGTPTPRAGSGTEEEFNRAAARLGTREVQIMMYFKDSPPASMHELDLSQLAQVKALRERITDIGLYWEFDNTNDLGNFVFEHLRMHVKNFKKTWGFAQPLTGNSNYESEERAVRREVDGISIAPTKKLYARETNIPWNYNKTFTVRYPIIFASSSRSISLKTPDAFDFEKVFRLSVEDEQTKSTWLSNLDYSVNYIKWPLVNLILSADGCGAYPSQRRRSIVVNVQTGMRLTAADLFDDAARLRLASIVNKFVDAELELIRLRLSYAYLEIPAANSEFANNEYHWTSETLPQFRIEDLNNFSVNETGITFHFDFGFPYVKAAAAPEASYQFSYEALEHFLRSESVVRKLGTKANT